MAKKRDTDKDRKPRGEKAVSRRDFVKSGAAAGVGAAVLSTSGTALAQVSPVEAIQWHYEADVVVIGGGCTGLPAAIRARDLGASVIVVDQNFDLGGKMLHSGGWVSLGGGDPLQQRDIAGEGDREGFVTAPRQHTVEELTEDPDFLFRDHTDWSVMDAAAQAPVPLQRTRSPSRLCRQLLRHQGIPDGELRPLHPYIRHARQWRHVARPAGDDLPHGRSDHGHQEGHDLETGRRNRGGELESLCAAADGPTAPRSPARARASTAPLSRGAWSSAPVKRASGSSSTATWTRSSGSSSSRAGWWVSGRAIRRGSIPRRGARLESLWQNGNVDDRTETIFIRARKAIVIGAGGHGANPQFRSMFYPAWREPAFVSSGWALLGPRGQDASGIIAGMRSRGQPRGDAAESRVRQHVPFPGRAGHARSLHRHAAGPPDVLVPGIDGHSPWQRFLPALDRRQPGGQAVLQRTACHQEAGRRRVSGRARRRASRSGGSTTCSSIGAMRASKTSERPTQSPTAFMPPWR